jgi:hypothetical protein
LGEYGAWHRERNQERQTFQFHDISLRWRTLSEREEQGLVNQECSNGSAQTLTMVRISGTKPAA